MTYAVVFFAATAGALLVIGFANMIPNQTHVLKKRLAGLQVGAMSYRELQERRRRQAKRDRIEALLVVLGTKVKPSAEKVSQTRRLLMHAGFRTAQAPTIFLGMRVTGAAAAVVGLLLLSVVAQLTMSKLLMLTALAGLLGWMMPVIIVTRKAKKVLLDAARDIGQLAAKPDSAALDAAWQKVESEFKGLHKNVAMGG